MQLDYATTTLPEIFFDGSRESLARLVESLSPSASETRSGVEALQRLHQIQIDSKKISIEQKLIKLTSIIDKLKLDDEVVFEDFDQVLGKRLQELIGFSFEFNNFKSSQPKQRVSKNDRRRISHRKLSRQPKKVRRYK